MITLILILVVFLALSFWIWQTVKPNPEKNGGSLDAFIEENPLNMKDSKNSQPDPYKKTFLEPGKQVLILYATEYGFSEVAFSLFFLSFSF